MILSAYKKYTTRIVLLILLLTMVGIAWFGIAPLKQAVREKMRGIQEFYARRENREKQVARLPELKAQYNAILGNEKLLSILISDGAVVDVVKTLEGLAGESHLELSIKAKDNGQIVEPKKVVPKPATPAKTAAVPSAKTPAKPKPVDILNDIAFDRYLYLNVKVRGQYNDAVVFLHKMETLPTGLDVVRVEMQKGETKDPATVTAVKSTNPFLVSGSTPGGTAEPAAAGQDIFEAVFDVVVYVKKQD